MAGSKWQDEAKNRAKNASVMKEQMPEPQETLKKQLKGRCITGVVRLSIEGVAVMEKRYGARYARRWIIRKWQEQYKDTILTITIIPNT